MFVLPRIFMFILVGVSYKHLKVFTRSQRLVFFTKEEVAHFVLEREYSVRQNLPQSQVLTTLEKI